MVLKLATIRERLKFLQETLARLEELKRVSRQVFLGDFGISSSMSI